MALSHINASEYISAVGSYVVFETMFYHCAGDPSYQCDVGIIKQVPSSIILGLDSSCVMSTLQLPKMVHNRIEFIDEILTIEKTDKITLSGKKRKI